jgi:hypothetical protein
MIKAAIETDSERYSLAIQTTKSFSASNNALRLSIVTIMHLRSVLQSMQPICTHKISVQRSELSHAYPIIRLSREFPRLAGTAATIYGGFHNLNSSI